MSAETETLRCPGYGTCRLPCLGVGRIVIRSAEGEELKYDAFCSKHHDGGGRQLADVENVLRHVVKWATDANYPQGTTVAIEGPNWDTVSVPTNPPFVPVQRPASSES